MKTEFAKSFLKELDKLRNKTLKAKIKEQIIAVESAADITRVRNVKKLIGYDFHYRIRIGEYRIGLKMEGDTIVFVTFDHRKDIYKTFP